MRIVLVTDTYHPSSSGAVVFTDTLAQALKERGHVVSIFAQSSKGGFHLEERNGIPVYRFPSFQSPFREDARMVIPSPIQLRAALEAISPDVVHMQSAFGLAAATLRIARKMDIPVVATHHFSFEFIFSYFKFIKSITLVAVTAYLGRIYEKCAAITCPTVSIKKELTEAGLETDLKVISNGVDLDRFQTGPRDEEMFSTTLPSVAKDTPCVLSIGRIDKDKRTDVLLEAFHLMIMRGSMAHLLIVGTGNQLPELKQYVESNNLQNQVTFYGRVKHESPIKPRLFHLADVFAISSPIDTQSLATLEAVASGLPGVAVNAGALPELIQDGINGFTTPVGDALAFSYALEKLCKNTELLLAMGKKSREIASHHALPKTIDRFISLYESVLVAK